MGDADGEGSAPGMADEEDGAGGGGGGARLIWFVVVFWGSDSDQLACVRTTEGPSTEHKHTYLLPLLLRDDLTRDAYRLPLIPPHHIHIIHIRTVPIPIRPIKARPVGAHVHAGEAGLLQLCIIDWFLILLVGCLICWVGGGSVGQLIESLDWSTK